MKQSGIVSCFATLALCTAPSLGADVEKMRPAATRLHAPPGSTMEQVLHGERVFHGEVAGGRCSICHGTDAKGTENGNDLTLGLWIWGDGSLTAIRNTVQHNMKVAPGMDGNLMPEDVDAVAAYVWALGHQRR